MNLQVKSLLLNEFTDYEYDAHIKPIYNTEHIIRVYQLDITPPPGFKLEDLFDRFEPGDDGHLRIVVTAYQPTKEE